MLQREAEMDYLATITDRTIPSRYFPERMLSQTHQLDTPSARRSENADAQPIAFSSAVPRNRSECSCTLPPACSYRNNLSMYLGPGIGRLVPAADWSTRR